MPSDPEATDACDDGIDQTGTDCAAMVETARQRLYHPPYPQCERHSVRRRRLELSLSTESESQNCALPAENLRVHKSPSVSEQQVHVKIASAGTQGVVSVSFAIHFPPQNHQPGGRPPHEALLSRSRRQIVW